LDDVEADSSPFAVHLQMSGGTVTAFANLHGDAQLVVPVKDESVVEQAYAHLAEFTRAASRQQQRELWARVGKEMLAALSETPGKPRWLSTSGAGVYWLHVRIDTVPKYYTHAPFREFPYRPQ
jgi:hypothetical protein